MRKAPCHTGLRVQEVRMSMEFVEEFTAVEKARIATEFSRTSNVHYLDTAGAALYAESQIKEVCNVLTANLFCNPHTSRTTENIIDQVRFR
jgi:molybdenum cofactor sulfurtransferase